MNRTWRMEWRTFLRGGLLALPHLPHPTTPPETFSASTLCRKQETFPAAVPLSRLSWKSSATLSPQCRTFRRELAEIRRFKGCEYVYVNVESLKIYINSCTFAGLCVYERFCHSLEVNSLWRYVARDNEENSIWSGGRRANMIRERKIKKFIGRNLTLLKVESEKRP